MTEKPLSASSGFERVGALTIAVLILIPLVLGVLLTSALATPTSHLDRVTAAIVNDDNPVTVNGKTVPLGRQFSAALIAGGDSMSFANASGSNGAAGSTPSNVSGQPNFTWVLTNDKDAASGLDSGQYAAVVTIPKSFSANATSISGPADDAKQAIIQVDTSPASAFVDPALAAAITSAATTALNQQLTAQYLQNVYAAFNTLNEQIGQAADGAQSVSDGAASVSDGAASLSSGAATLSSGLISLDSGAASLSNGMSQLAQQSQSLPAQTEQLAQGASAVAAATGDAASALDGATSSFEAVVAEVCQTPGPVCDRATAALSKLQSADSSVSELNSGASAVASGNQQLADAMPGLVNGIDQAASGASDVAAGAAQADSGAASLASGAQSLAGGAAKVDSGAAQVADGLDQAVQKIPTYSDTDISTLSTLVSQPVAADQQASGQGTQSVPLFCVIALWIGGMVTALARRAVPGRQLMSTASSLSITARSSATGAILGAAQGALIAPILLFSLSVDPHEWLSFTSLSVLAGMVFVVVNQGLAAAFGAAGRLVALIITVIALGVGLVSTVPTFFSGLAGFFPTTPALQMLRAAAFGDAAGGWLGAAGCLLFGIIGFALVLAGVMARRSVRIRDLRPLPASA